MESDTLAVCPLQYRLKPPARHTGRDRSVRLHRGRKHPAGIHLFAVLPQHGQHRRRQHQFSDGCLGFGRDDLQFAVYRVRLLVDGQHAGFKVQILPPQWTHGGVALGPKPRSYTYSLNKKVKRLALKSALSAKVQDGSMIAVSYTHLSNLRRSCCCSRNYEQYNDYAFSNFI